MKNLIKITIATLVLFFIGILIAYQSMLITYDKVNKEQAIVEVKQDVNCNNLSSQKYQIELTL